MHWSPDVLTAMRRARLYEIAEQSRQPHRTTPTPVRTLRWAATIDRNRPDYGCVDWFVYEEQPADRDRK